MADGRVKHQRRPFIDVARDAWLPAIGLACTILTPEINHLPSSSPVASPAGARTISSLIQIALLLVFILILHAREKQRFRTPNPQAQQRVAVGLYVIAAIVAAAATFTELVPTVGGEVLDFAASLAGTLTTAIFLVCWFEYLHPSGSRHTAFTAAFAGIITGAIEFVVLGFQPLMATVFLGLTPLISAACYAVVILSKRTFSAETNANQSFLSMHFSEASQSSVVAFLILIAGYAMVFGYIHRQWVPLQDGGTTSFIIQSGAAIGTILAGIIVAVIIVDRFWNPIGLMAFSGALTAFVLVALWLSSYVEPTWVFVYLIALNVAHKGVYLLIAIAPFFPSTPPQSGLRWLICYTAFEVGVLLSNIIHPSSESNMFVLVCLSIMAILFVCQAIITLRGMRVTPDMEVEIISLNTEEQSETPAIRTHKLQNACAYLAAENDLTNREQEILIYLARGRTASYIAEHLFIAPSTAKTHIRHIYDKLGVHTQQELISSVQHTISDLRNK